MTDFDSKEKDRELSDGVKKSSELLQVYTDTKKSYQKYRTKNKTMIGLLKACMNNKTYYNSLESDITEHYDSMKDDFMRQLNKRSYFQTFTPNDERASRQELMDPKPRKKVRTMSYVSVRSQKSQGNDPETMIYQGVSD